VNKIEKLIKRIKIACRRVRVIDTQLEELELKIALLSKNSGRVMKEEIIISSV
jgi:hypothetical protein